MWYSKYPCFPRPQTLPYHFYEKTQKTGSKQQSQLQPIPAFFGVSCIFLRALFPFCPPDFRLRCVFCLPFFPRFLSTSAPAFSAVSNAFLTLWEQLRFFRHWAFASLRSAKKYVDTSFILCHRETDCKKKQQSSSQRAVSVRKKAGNFHKSEFPAFCLDLIQPLIFLYGESCFCYGVTFFQSVCSACCQILFSRRQHQFDTVELVNFTCARDRSRWLRYWR